MDERSVELFLGLPKGSFDHIPIYARVPALEAIAKVREMEQAHLFRPGLYYIVLADLTGSTESSKVLGVKENTKRVEWFVTACVEALANFEIRNYFQFLKEIGDATLFIFSSFDDVLDWSVEAEKLFESYTQEYTWPGIDDLTGTDDELFDEYERMTEVFRLRGKKVVHLGEVSYIEKGNPVALAVNQVFKIEKLFGAGDLGCTDIVRRSVSPIVKDRRLQFVEKSKVILPGESEETTTYTITS